MEHDNPTVVLHWNYRGFTEFPIQKLEGDECEITDIYLKENLITCIPSSIGKLEHLESLYLSGNDITELPKEISNLRCLKCLDVSGNRLRSVPEEIGDARSLKFLILDENELTELPLRIAELRALRYLSVCDNKLKWLPQRPVYNYFHCEFRFWRNTSLKTIPYSLWYHMFRDQQTRSLNIGCLAIPQLQEKSKGTTTCRIKIAQGSVDVTCPPPHGNVLKDNTPPSLYEISRRTLYTAIEDASKRLSSECGVNNKHGTYQNLWEHLHNINIFNGNDKEYDLNGNSLEDMNKDNVHKIHTYNIKRCKSNYVPKDIVDDYLCFLPNFMREDLCNGPISRCEYVRCKRPVFDYAYYEFCIRKIILIDNSEEVILSAAFCSKSCADLWKTGENALQWTLLE